MSQPDAAKPEAVADCGNVGVTVGCILLVACFFLPWIAFGSLSAMEIAGDGDCARAAFGVLRLRHPSPPAVTRLLFFVPILALSTMMLDGSVLPGRPGRLAARLGVLAAGALLTGFLAFIALNFGGYMAAGFWGSLMGALFILVGAIFNVARNE